MSETPPSIMGVCCDCHGFKSSSLIDIAIGDKRRDNVVEELYLGKWEDIVQDCAFCSEVKSLLKARYLETASAKLNLPRLEDLIVESWLEPADEKWNSPTCFCVRLGTDDQEAGDASQKVWICFVPHTLIQPVDTYLHNLSFVKTYLNDCYANHIGSCARNRGSRFALNVIDCRTRQICQIPEGTPYVCLSYVWGNALSTDQNSQQLSLPLPKTIEDSIWVAAQLDIPHLWVDRYCINQQCATEKHRLISNMDVIYSGATVTIIAATGTSPHDGLPGIRGTPRQKPYTSKVQSDHAGLTTIVDPSIEIKNSIWNSRAWTYQEQILSRCRLFFTRFQIYIDCDCNATRELKCSQRHAPEDSTSSARSSSSTDVPRDNPIPDGLARARQQIDLFYWQLENYYERQMSYVDDTVKAFLGVLRACNFYNDTDHIHIIEIHGLPVFYSRSFPSFRVAEYDQRMLPDATPTSTFAFSLCWRLFTGTHKSWIPPATRTTLYPSWSWASIKAERHPQLAAKLDFRSKVSRVAHQEDVQIWITSASGRRVNLEDYVKTHGTDCHIEKSLGLAMFIKSWVIFRGPIDPRPVKTFDQAWRYSQAHKYANYRDYPQYNPEKDLAAIHLFTEKGKTTLEEEDDEEPEDEEELEDDEESEDDRKLKDYWSPHSLIVERVDESTWRRIGICDRGGNHHSIGEDTDVQTFLNTIKMQGSWENRSGWELRTLCII